MRIRIGFVNGYNMYLNWKWTANKVDYMSGENVLQIITLPK